MARVRESFALLLITGALWSCTATKATSASTAVAPQQVQLTQMNVNLYPTTKTICDPMGDAAPDMRSNLGLKADLFWLKDSQPRTEKVADLISQGVKSDSSLFFSQLNLPTRMFDKGFNNGAGLPLLDDQNNRLIEYFALHFKTVLHLAPDQPEGLYEFALLSDDGAVMRIRDDGGVYRTAIDNDGLHPTRLGCGSHVVDMKRDTEKLMELDYQQGPRYHISLILLMRKIASVDGNASKTEPACGQEGNELWFDPNNNSEPKKPYLDLVARGWTPLTKENYGLPNEAIFNPCKDGVTPKITGFEIAEKFSQGFVLRWHTNIPSTDQVVITDLVTQSQITTTSDNVLRLDHQVIVTGLKPNTQYGLQALSISDTYGQGMTTAIIDSTSIN